MTSLSLFPPSVDVRRPRGRPRASLSSRGLLRRIDCGRIRYHEGRTVEATARLLGVSARTVYRWQAEALELDGPEGEALRSLAAGRRTKAS